MSTELEASDSPTERLNTTLLDFEHITVGAVIGQGAYGQVFRGIFKGNDVAIKRGAVRNRDAEAQRYLTQELEALSAAGEHPHLLKYYGACMHGGFAYIVTEFMAGGDLTGLILDTDVPLPWALRVRVARDAASGMACLHARGLMHRDIKADNILVDDEWRAVLADYGFARRIEGSGPGRPTGGFTPAAMTILGSSPFMAPEVLFGEPYDQRADVFSFGTTLAMLACRRAPGERGFMERHPRRKFAVDLDDLRSAMPADTPPSFKEACMQCLAYEPEDRLDSAMVLEWMQELAGEMGGEGRVDGSIGVPSELMAARKARAQAASSAGLSATSPVALAEDTDTTPPHQ